ncbi:MAG: hypothetical protein ACKOD2_04160 [Ilumatobacteraceae bacterium]
MSVLEAAGPDEDQAWDAATAKYGVDVRGESEWRILSETPDELRLITEALPGSQPSGAYRLATFIRDGDSWEPDNLTSCTATWGREGWLNVDSVEMNMSRPPRADATSLELVVLDDSPPCGTGDPDAMAVVVEETEDTITLVVLTRPALSASSATCPPGFVSLDVILESPLGDRSVVDGSTQPGRPLTVLRTDQQVHVIMLGPSVAGWWDDDNATWVDAEPVTPGIPLANGTEMQVATLDGPQPSVVAGIPIRECEPHGTWTTSLEPAIDWNADTVAVNGTWPLIPRPVTVLSPTIPDYQRAVVEYLEQRGLSNVPVSVEQVIRTDLDGDGIDEVLVAAQHPDTNTAVGAQAGYFSVVLLRRVVTGGVDTIAVFEDLHTVADTDFPTMLVGKVSAIADLNGDNTMEIAIKWRYYEGNGTDVYETTTNSVDKVLGTGCGS